jgi:hypothetical protein
MPRHLLTDALLRAWGPDSSRWEISDTQVRGLIARGEPSGNPTFHVRRRVPGAGRPRTTLGSYPEISLRQARGLAITVLADWQAGRVRPEPTPAPLKPMDAKATVAGRLREWQDGKDREWSLRHATGVNRIIRQEIVPALGTRALRVTTRADWIELVTAKKRTAPAMASLLYRTISAFLNYAEAAG